MGRASHETDDEEYAAVIEFLGLVIYATVVGIGLLDMKIGLSPFAMYRSVTVAGVGRSAPATGRRGDGTSPLRQRPRDS
jgi:hypothetical protein